MMYLVHGGSYNSVNKKIRKHMKVPVVSPDRVCIRACGGGLGITTNLEENEHL